MLVCFEPSRESVPRAWLGRGGPRRAVRKCEIRFSLKNQDFSWIFTHFHSFSLTRDSCTPDSRDSKNPSKISKNELTIVNLLSTEPSTCVTGLAGLGRSVPGRARALSSIFVEKSCFSMDFQPPTQCLIYTIFAILARLGEVNAI